MESIWGDGLDDMQLQGGCDGGYACLLLAVFLLIILALLIVLAIFVWGFFDVLLSIPVSKLGGDFAGLLP